MQQYNINIQYMQQYATEDFVELKKNMVLYRTTSIYSTFYMSVQPFVNLLLYTRRISTEMLIVFWL
jgi:hypothetical protein